jgi:hypothetical protein
VCTDAHLPRAVVGEDQGKRVVGLRARWVVPVPASVGRQLGHALNAFEYIHDLGPTQNVYTAETKESRQMNRERIDKCSRYNHQRERSKYSNSKSGTYYPLPLTIIWH